MSHLSSSNRIVNPPTKACGPSANADYNYTDLANAMAGLSAGDILLVKAGTYNLSASLIIPSGVTVIFEEINGGVVVDFGGGAYHLGFGAASKELLNADGGEVNGTFESSGTVYSWSGSSHTTAESAVNADPTAYSLIYAGSAYPIQSINTSIHKITLTGTVRAPFAGAASPAFVGKTSEISSNITMSGKLTVQNTSNTAGIQFTNLVGCDFSALTWVLNNVSFYAYNDADVELGTFNIKGQTFTNARFPITLGWYLIGVGIRVNVSDSLFTSIGAASSHDIVRGGSATADQFVVYLEMDCDIYGNGVTGSATDITMGAINMLASVTESAVRGVSRNNAAKGAGTSGDWHTNTNVNTGGLRFSTTF